MKSFLLSVLLVCAWPAAADEWSPAREIAQDIGSREAAGSHDALIPTSPTDDVFDRLITLLNAIPTRWESLPAPVVPASGRSVDEILGAASKEQKEKAFRWIDRLRSTSPTERPVLIQGELRSHVPTELDLWLPGQLAQLQLQENLGDTAVTLEAWLQWSEAMGRKDILLFAGSFAIDVVRIGEGAAVALPLIQIWAHLPPTPGTERSQAVLQSSLADIFLRLREKQKALDAYRAARQLYQSDGSRLGEGNAWRGEAEVLFRLGGKQEIREALVAYQHARQLFQAIGNKLSQGNTWLGEADVFFRLRRNQEALGAYLKARQLFQDEGNALGQGNTWRGEAGVLFRLRRNQKALDAYGKARQLFQGARNPRGQGNTWLGEAEVLFFRGQNQEALDAYRKSRQFFQAAKDQLGQGNTWLGEASALLLLDENQKSLDAYRAARQLFQEADTSLPSSENQLGQANTWKGEADVLFRLGENHQALDSLQKARRLFQEVEDEIGEGNTWKGEADILFRLDENQKAMAGYRRARQLFKAGSDLLGQGNTWEREADVLFWLGEDRKALDAYREGRKFFQAAVDQLGQGNTWLGEARVLRQGRAWRKAGEAASAAIVNFRSTGIVANQIPAFLLKADVEYRAGNRTGAAESASEAIRLHSQRRKTWITDRHRTEQEETISRAYDLLVPLRAQEGRAAEALRLAEEARSRVLLDLLATPPGRGESVPSVELMAERQRLKAKIWQIEEELRGTPKLDRQAELRISQRLLNQELEWNYYQRIATDDKSFPEEPPLGTTSIQALTRETGPLLLYYVAEREVWGFLVLPGATEIILRSMTLSRDELRKEIRALAHDLANPVYEPRAETQVRKLWDLLVAPFAEQIPVDGPLVLVPHGPLHELPFEALRDEGGKRLFERWRVSITPSVSTLASAQHRHAAFSPRDSFLGFSSGRGLNLTAREVAEISGLFGEETAFHPTEANYQNYVDLVAQARHLLIATRGVHIEGSRTGTYLEIESTPKVHDSRLTAAEIATIPLQAELVTLAACDTSYGQALLSDERLDLTRSFLIARAAAVLATRWKVPEDRATSRFLADFYRAYRQGGPQGTGLRKDEALTEARRRSRDRGDPAEVWAAWVLVGDAR